MSDFLIAHDGQQSGPYSEAEIREGLKGKKNPADRFVLDGRHDGMEAEFRCISERGHATFPPFAPSALPTKGRRARRRALESRCGGSLELSIIHVGFRRVSAQQKSGCFGQNRKSEKFQSLVLSLSAGLDHRCRLSRNFPSVITKGLV
ncbi:MAG: DUF4339 domain-containing protein [Zoogloeaceae bacterium]|jgi:hypothetical protein|nr:DUF4339 domain-containing protein [Zoogloeaceae bacterium]